MEQNDVKFTEDFSTGLETIQPLDENFDKFITRIKKYSPKKGDVFGVYVEPDTPQQTLHSLIRNLEIFSQEVNVHFIVIPNNMEISDITSKLSNELRSQISQINTTASS